MDATSLDGYKNIYRFRVTRLYGFATCQKLMIYMLRVFQLGSNYTGIVLNVVVVAK